MPEIYLEGTDGVGKTTIAQGLLNLGIVCKDRHREVISKYMMFDVPMEKRIQEYSTLLHEDLIVIFLVNQDGDELMRRIFSREKKPSDFDLHAVEYNRLYLDTYKEMARRNLTNERLYLVDLTSKTIDESLQSVLEIIKTRT
jgi:broad-specificity NMP kinase